MNPQEATLSLIQRYKEGGGVPLSTRNIGKAIGSTYNPDSESGSLTERYAPESGRLAAETKKLDPIYGDNTKPDEQTIRAQKLNQAQATINAINSKYASIEAADRELIDQMQRERRASNVLSGLSGSNVGATRSVQTTAEGKAIVEKTAQMKNAEISEALSNAETRASEEFAREKQNYIQNAKDRFNAEAQIRANVKEQANNEIAKIAAGMGWDEFKRSKPRLVDQYMDELDTDETGLKAYFVQANKDKLVSDKAEVIRLANGKTVSRFYYQKPDGTMTYTDIDVPNQQKKVDKTYSTDDGVVLIYDDGTSSIIRPGDKGETPPNLPSWEEYLQAAQDEARMTFGTDMRAELKKQYDEQVNAYKKSNYKGSEFTAQEKKKLEQGGLLNAPRQEQLDFLYGKDDEDVINPFG